MGYKRYPKKEIFPNKISGPLKQNDDLKSKELSEEILKQIEEALKVEKDIYIKAAISIAKGTGLRISEILILEEGCVIHDLLSYPIMTTFSFKNDKERAIPITREIADTVLELEKYTKMYRINGRRELFLAPRRRKNIISIVPQYTIRRNLEAFVKRHNIIDSSGNLAKVNFHQFRHTLGMKMLNNGANPLEVKELLGQESLHSTGLYSQIRDEELNKEYRKIGFIGKLTNELSEETLGLPVTPEKILAGALPDGTCMKAFEGKTSCGSFNKCLLCPKFITTPQHLEIHKRHLERIRQDRSEYMKKMYICNHDKVDLIESALVAIIQQLEEMQ